MVIPIHHAVMKGAEDIMICAKSRLRSREIPKVKLKFDLNAVDYGNQSDTSDVR